MKFIIITYEYVCIFSDVKVWVYIYIYIANFISSSDYFVLTFFFGKVGE